MQKRYLCAITLAATFLAASLAAAKEEILTAVFTQRAGPNLYRVTFPPETGVPMIELPITGGEFVLGLDRETLEARIISWRQDIAPIDLFGASTGPITVRLDDSQPARGLYRPDTGSFEVTATFILEFDDSQLSDLGFVSPFIMTATERGYFYGVGQLTTISMYVEGNGSFAAGEFSYVCMTSAEYKYDLPPNMGQPGDVNHDKKFDIADPIAVINFMFLSAEVGCPGAIDVNGDGLRNISDVISMLDYLFLGGDPPPEPAVECAI